MKLSILDRFQCLAGDCPDDCCHGWRIDVDKPTLDKWRDLPTDALAGRLSDALREEAGEWFLQRREDGCCTFLDEGLCAIQKQLGHDMLPQTCQQYPRVTVGLASHPIHSAYLSCPEIVRLLLEQPIQSDQFVSNEESPSITRFDDRYTEKLLAHFIRSLLGHSETTPGEVLYHTGQTLAGLLSRETFHKTSRELEKYYADEQALEALIKTTRKAQRNRQLKLVRESAAQFWFAAMSLCRVCPDFDDKRTSTETEAVDAQQNYMEITRLWRESGTLEDTLQAALKRYLEVKLVNHGFPLAVNHNQLVDTFLECAMALAQIVYLARLKNYEGELFLSELVTIIYKVERSMVHNDAIDNVLAGHPGLKTLGNYTALFLDWR